MATTDKIRVGIIGASPHRGFASIAHIPALQALPGLEITAVCTTRQESADATARHFGIPLLPVVLELQGPRDAGLIHDSPEPNFGREQHLSYMVQWYSLAALTVVLYLVLNWRKA